MGSLFTTSFTYPFGKRGAESANGSCKTSPSRRTRPKSARWWIVRRHPQTSWEKHYAPNQQRIGENHYANYFRNVFRWEKTIKDTRDWIVERMFGWFNFNRKPAKDYEALNDCSVAFIHLIVDKLPHAQHLNLIDFNIKKQVD